MSVAVDPDEERLGEWLEFRHDLHRHPELGFTEFRTQAILAERLGALGCSLRMGKEVTLQDAMLDVHSDLAGGHHAMTFDFEEIDIARLLQTALELASAHMGSRRLMRDSAKGPVREQLKRRVDVERQI